MQMIPEETEVLALDVEPSQPFLEQREVHLVVDRVEKDGTLVVAARDDVRRDAGRMHAKRTDHGAPREQTKGRCRSSENTRKIVGPNARLRKVRECCAVRRWGCAQKSQRACLEIKNQDLTPVTSRADGIIPACDC